MKVYDLGQKEAEEGRKHWVSSRMKSIKENVIRLKWNSNKIGDALENHFFN